MEHWRFLNLYFLKIKIKLKYIYIFTYIKIISFNKSNFDSQSICVLKNTLAILSDIAFKFKKDRSKEKNNSKDRKFRYIEGIIFMGATWLSEIHFHMESSWTRVEPSDSVLEVVLCVLGIGWIEGFVTWEN